MINFNKNNMNSQKVLLLLSFLVFTGHCYIRIEAIPQTPQSNITGIPCNDTNCKTCWALNKSQCGSCKDGYVGDSVQNICASCKSKVNNCTSCIFDPFIERYQCSSCDDQMYPYPSKYNCTSCKKIYDNCLHCSTRKQDFTTYISCDTCAQGYQVSSKGDCVLPQESSSNTVIIVVSIVVGLLVLGGVGFAIFRFMKKKKQSTLLQTYDS